MHLLFTGCFHGEVAQEELWTTTVQRIADTYRRAGGYTKMSELQRMPGTLALNAAAFGAVLGRRYANLKAVALRPIYRRESQDDLPLVTRFGTDSVLDRDMLRATKRFDRHKTPGSELMFEFLRELGRSVLERWRI
jgi:hypothetical protein